MADDGGPYSALKVFHHQERVAQLRRGEQIVPAQVQLVISDTCNHDCSFCSYRWSGNLNNELFTQNAALASFGTDNPKRMIDTAKVREILDDCAAMGVGAILWTGGGEPTVHPDHVELMRYALNLGLDCALITNGELFKPGHLDNLLRFQWVRFSLDAGTPDTYGAIRRINPARMERVLHNIRALVQAREQFRDAGHPCDVVIGTGFVVTRENWREVVLATELAKSLGVDNIRISAALQPDDDAYFADFHAEAAALCKQAEAIGNDSFRVFNFFGARLQDLIDKHPDYSRCGFQQFVTYIGADLNVYRCCILAYSERGVIGSLKRQRFRELWESEQKRRDFDTFDARGCPRCWFNNRNRVILYALDPAPLHANFV